MKPKISIVVPIYNMERYLARCLESLLGQTLREIEVIAIDDGSSDASSSIALKFAAGDERLTFIKTANQGVSAARNLGLRHCRGSYIGFADPDDWADPGMYEALYAEAATFGADIAMCGYVREFGEHSKEKVFPLADRTLLTGERLQQELTRRLVGPVAEETASPEHLDAWGTVWNKLYRRELLEGGPVFTDLREIGSCEDTLFNVAAFRKAHSFLFLNRSYYHYWKANGDSITTRYRPDLPEQFRRLHELLEQCAPGGELYREALRNRMAMHVLGLGLNVISGANPAGMPGKLRELTGILKEPGIGEALSAFDSRFLPAVWKTFFGIAKTRKAALLLPLLYGVDFMRKKPKRGRKLHDEHPHSAGGHGHESRGAGNDAHELLSSAERKRHSI